MRTKNLGKKAVQNRILKAAKTKDPLDKEDIIQEIVKKSNYAKSTIRQLIKNEELVLESEAKSKEVTVPSSDKEKSGREILKQELHDAIYQFSKTLNLGGKKTSSIFWIDDEIISSYMLAKILSRIVMGDGKKYVENPMFFFAHSKDEIKGKAQLIGRSKVPIKLLEGSLVKKETRDSEGKVIQSEEVVNSKFIGENGSLRNTFKKLEIYFWQYELIYEGIRYFVHSEKELPADFCILKGIIITIDSRHELTKTLKLGTTERFFIVKEYEEALKPMPKEELVKYTQKLSFEGLGAVNFLNFMCYNQQYNNFNTLSIETALLKVAFLLSGTLDGWPLSMVVMGRPGTNKTMAWIEQLDQIYQEEEGIVEGGASRLKGLIPSFKNNPVNVGYLVKCQRIALVDELNKLIDAERSNHQGGSGYLGTWNPIIEHKKRKVTSGISETIVQPTAKILITSNPLSDRTTLQSHIGIIDQSTMSRLFFWVIDKKEEGLISQCAFSEAVPFELEKSPESTQKCLIRKFFFDKNGERENNSIINKINKNKNYNLYFRGILELKEGYSPSLAIIDSANAFICDISKQKVQELRDKIGSYIAEPLKTEVWIPRGNHHVHLLVDGICKFRCLFRDFDVSFSAKKEDYDIAEQILLKMAESFNYDLSPKGGTL